MRPPVCVVSLLLVVGPVATHAEDLEVRVDPVVRIVPGEHEHDRGLMTKRAAEDMMLRSPTFAEMVRRLGGRTDVFLYVSATLPAGSSLKGRTHFVLDGGVLIAHVELKDLSKYALVRRGEALAHEVAHVYEIACLTSARTRADLRQVLTRRGDRRRDGGVETPFAVAVERAIHREWAGEGGAESQLDQLANRLGPGSATIQADSKCLP